MKTFLTIAASDCIGGAGIQADILTASHFGLYAASALTAVTAQNSCGVEACHPVGPDMLERQLHCIMADFRPDAVKVGMMPDTDTVEIVSRFLRRFSLDNVVIDPVLRPSFGNEFTCTGVDVAIVEKLLPVATLITPNIDEFKTIAQIAGGWPTCRAMLLKGGHTDHDDDNTELAVDRLYAPSFPGSHPIEFKAVRIETSNTHGSGCVLSSAIASCLALGKDIPQAVRDGKEFLHRALSHGKEIRFGKCGYGPSLLRCHIQDKKTHTAQTR